MFFYPQERKRAAELGYADPINPTYEATTKMYEECLEESFRGMQRRPRGRVAVMVATHNENTVHFALRRLNILIVCSETVLTYLLTSTK